MSEVPQYHKSSLIFASLADAYIEKGMVQEAITLLEEGITLHPGYSYAHRLLGRCYYQLKDYAKAEQELRLASKDSNDVAARYYLTLIFLEQKKEEEAKALFEEISRINADSEEAKELRKKFEVPEEKPEEVTEVKVEAEEEIDDVTNLLKELTSLPVINGGLLLEKDGLLISAQGVENPDEMAGFISGIANQCWLTGGEFKIGELESFSLSLDEKTLVSFVGSESILTVLSNEKRSEGLATLYSNKFYQRLKRALEK